MQNNCYSCIYVGRHFSNVNFAYSLSNLSFLPIACRAKTTTDLHYNIYSFVFSVFFLFFLFNNFIYHQSGIRWFLRFFRRIKFCCSLLFFFIVFVVAVASLSCFWLNCHARLGLLFVHATTYQWNRSEWTEI